MYFGIMMVPAEMFMVIHIVCLLHFQGFRLTTRKIPKNGMVIDFTDLKSIVKKEIVTVFDHAVVVSRQFDKEKTEMFTKMFGNTVLVDYQPTCENLVSDFASRIKTCPSRDKTA